MNLKEELRRLVNIAKDKDLEDFKNDVKEYIKFLPDYLRYAAARGDSHFRTIYNCYIQNKGQDIKRWNKTFSFDFNSWTRNIPFSSLLISPESYMEPKCKYLYEELKKLDLPIKIIIEDFYSHSRLFFELEW